MQNNPTGLQAGIYVYTFDTPGTSDNIRVYIGLLTKQSYRYCPHSIVGTVYALGQVLSIEIYG
jgi:hypothetical protein